MNEGSEASVEDSSSGPSPEGGAGADASPGLGQLRGGLGRRQLLSAASRFLRPGLQPTREQQGLLHLDRCDDVLQRLSERYSAADPICDGSDLSSEACFNCLASQPSNATWGAVILYSSAWWLNLGGCYALIGATAACATAVQEQAECEAAACSNTCSTASNSEGQACLASADGTVCSAYTTSISTNCPSTMTTAAACGATTNAANPELAQYQAVASTFCE